MDSEIKALLERLVKAVEENNYWGRLNVENNLRASSKYNAFHDMLGETYLRKYDEESKRYVIVSDQEIIEDTKEGARLRDLRDSTLRDI